MNSLRAVRARAALFGLALTLGAAWTRRANAEVSLVKTDDLELYTSGRVGGFFSLGFGDALPVPLQPATETLRPGGGFDPGNDTIPKKGSNGMDDPTQQGTFRSMRVRSGFVPNVLGFGMRTHLTPSTELTAYISIWTTIEAQGGRKTTPVVPDAREGYAKLQGPWGTFLAGRALDLFSRGATENDFLYGHGYALGYPGNIDSSGPTAGLIGFGVLAAFFSPGIVYSTPTLGGLQLNVGVYDPVPAPGNYEATRGARPETELTYDLQTSSVKLHLFGNGAVQKLYHAAVTDGVTAYGVGYGGRVEAGPFHLGVAGHHGKGLGLSYALEASPTTFSQDNSLRTFDGYSAFAQYATGTFDFNLGAGVSRVFLLESDKLATNSSLIKSQVGMSAVVVYHASKHVHFSLDYFRGQFKWYLGEKQNVNFISSGMTVTW
ncbi:MAG: porin [Pseudomonadota bacterium]